MLEKIIVIVLGVAFVAIMLALSFVATSAIIYGICWAFSLPFSLKYAFGLWLVLWLASGVFKRSGKEN